MSTSKIEKALKSAFLSWLTNLGPNQGPMDKKTTLLKYLCKSRTYTGKNSRLMNRVVLTCCLMQQISFLPHALTRK